MKKPVSVEVRKDGGYFAILYRNVWYDLTPGLRWYLVEKQKIQIGDQIMLSTKPFPGARKRTLIFNYDPFELFEFNEERGVIICAKVLLRILGYRCKLKPKRLVLYWKIIRHSE